VLVTGWLQLVGLSWGGWEGVLFSFLVCYLGPFIVSFEVWVVGVMFFGGFMSSQVVQVGGGKKFVKVLGHPFTKFGALF